MSDQQGNTLTDNAIGWFWLGGVLLAVGAVVWYFFEDALKSAFRWFRWAEMWIVAQFTGPGHTEQWNGYTINFRQWLDAIPQTPATQLDSQTFSILSTLALEPVRLPIVILLGLMGIWAVTRGPGTQYRRKLNLDGLISAQAPNFPVIAPFVKFNPSNQPPRAPGMPVPAELPLFAEALGPEEWLAYHQVPIPDGKIDEDSAFMAFSRQLGPRWQGPAKLEPYKQILLAAFCLKTSRKRAEADHMLGRLAGCWTPDKGLQLSRDKKLHKEALKIVKNKSLAQFTLSKCNQHAFQTTALLRALHTARQEGGVLAPAQFVWLRGFDRDLWYPLNNLGRQAYHMEALGAMAHYKAEKRTQRPIPKPKLQEAIDSIEEYMNSGKARPIPQLDYSQSKKKRGVKKPKSKIK